ncbi:hypothetical protein ABE427_12605 [Acinetobacter higginsii]|uniref:hypothetical protein n=1 Tax=Acinetobacter higginsii TaxID=70347 RepID=UPI00300A45E4
MHILHTMGFCRVSKEFENILNIKKDEFHCNLAYTENPFINLCTSMSSGCCRSALFLFPKKNVLAVYANLLKSQLHNNIADFAEESPQ